MKSLPIFIYVDKQLTEYQCTFTYCTQNNQAKGDLYFILFMPTHKAYQIHKPYNTFPKYIWHIINKESDHVTLLNLLELKIYMYVKVLRGNLKLWSKTTVAYFQPTVCVKEYMFFTNFFPCHLIYMNSL